MKEFGANFTEETGEAAFYGPKIDIQIKNSSGKEETIATSQVDIVVPKRLGLVYTDSDGSKKTPIVIHRAILGSYERFVAYLLEQTEGRLPLWLAPVQIKILNLTDRNAKSAATIAGKLKDSGFRVEEDSRTETVQARIRDAEMQKIPYIIVIGDKEEANDTLAVRARGKKPAFGVKLDDFISQLKEEVRDRK